MQQPQCCFGSLPQSPPSMLQVKQLQKIYCWKFFSLLVVLKVSINNQTWSIKELTKASSFTMWLFPFSLVSQLHRRLWAPSVEHLVTDFKEVFVSTTKYSPIHKKPWTQLQGLHVLPKFRCPDAITIWCCLGDAIQPQWGSEHSPCTLPWSQAQA